MLPDVLSASLIDRASKIVHLALKSGADAADVKVLYSRDKSFSIRLGKTEGIDTSENSVLSLRVFVGQKVATVSTNHTFDIDLLVERAVDMAKVSLKNPFISLSDKNDLAHHYPDLDLFDPVTVNDNDLRDSALAMEGAALSVPGVSNSLGSSVSMSMQGIALVTSHGFSGFYMKTNFSRSVSVIAGKGINMERDYDFDSCVFYSDLRNTEEIGYRAGNFAVRRLNPHKMDTGSYTVVFDVRAARSLVHAIINTINGEAIARKTSFLCDSMGKQCFSRHITLIDDSFVKRASSSRPFDDEGISQGCLMLIKDGVLTNWLLSHSSACELGLRTNGRGVRCGSSVVAGSTNVFLEPGEATPEELIRNIKKGFYVTELIGHGVDLITGQYSQGASGFCIENGQLTYPVSGVTIASNLKEMFMSAVPANDIDRRYKISTPTLVIDNMTLAGQ
ncbi:TldE/PmbA protein [Liberibacter crescens BT-1]|uniref:TldE/PmbA protein n=1 Tax=Liberibacter crescens (strain BT-1) TaxID=1215343 RepID=L0ETE0_LIBCB|nr:TldD/PmbA family protein [Liberibacter crescens]AGA64222.1 TldE/PmbA protein [Liberibacter crescens BT-1]AMC12469.1 modulator protein [Liberibacter crescens]